MKANFWSTIRWLFVVPFLFLGIMEARADVTISDTLSVTGFIRQETALHTGEKNPNNVSQKDRNTLNLSRTFFQTEWTYKPNDTFKLYSKVKLISDQTQSWDSNLNDYDAFPLATPRYGGYLRATNDNIFDAEMSELYADVNLRNFWIRLGKQQIVWGETIGARILDQINPLDLSWHFQFEPEEFENIRMAQWALRVRYDVPPENMVSWLDQTYIEGFLNPGDIAPQVFPASGSPFNLKPPTSPVFKLTEYDRRGRTEYGFRIGGKVGQFAGTLNYLHLYADSGFWTSSAPLNPGPPSPANPFPTSVTYPQTDLYGLSFNYAFKEPTNVVVTYEGTYSPNEPYYDKATTLPSIKTSHTMKQAISFARSTFVLPHPTSAMMIQVQYSETHIWDNDLIKLTPAPFSSGHRTSDNNIDTDQHILALVLSQDLWHNNIALYFKVLYDFDDAHLIQPGVKYKLGDHWICDIYGVALGGPETRPGRFGGMSYANEIFARITYQF